MAPLLGLSTPSLPRSLFPATPAFSAGRVNYLSSARLKQHYPSSLCCRSQLPSFCKANGEQLLPQTFYTLATSENETAFVSGLLQRCRKVITTTSIGVTLLLVTLPANALVTVETLPALLNAIFVWTVAAIVYLFVAPLAIYYYLYKRWFKRKMPEAIFQFYLVFLFFPGLLLLAPFINFRGAPKEGAKEPWDEIRPS